MKEFLREMFTGANDKWSSKRIIGAMLLFIDMALWIDSHFSERVLNDSAFDTVLYTAGLMIGVGVLEKRLKDNNDIATNDEFK